MVRGSKTLKFIEKDPNAVREGSQDTSFGPSFVVEEFPAKEHDLELRRTASTSGGWNGRTRA